MGFYVFQCLGRAMPKGYSGCATRNNYRACLQVEVTTFVRMGCYYISYAGMGLAILVGEHTVLPSAKPRVVGDFLR